jgi:hypothetical protein
MSVSGFLLTTIVTVWLVAASALAQEPAATPRTADGHVDLNGSRDTATR